METVADAQATSARRKFAAPPVKLACLSCRASRTRCNGGRPCSSCTAKGHECVYRPSRRGGPRFRKREPGHGVPAPAPVPDEVPARPEQPLPIQTFIDPGAALGQLPDPVQDSDALFDSLFAGSFLGGFDGAGVALPPDLLAAPPSGPLVRTYRSDHSLLQAYYCWIHPYIPIFPPPETSPPVDEPVPVSQNEPFGAGAGAADFEPTTPVALALSAVLALVPCAEDTDPAGGASRLFRRRWAHFFAQAAIESIEAEAELPDSATAPHKALEASAAEPVARAPFHPRVPAALESIVALNLLSVYEYAQRGNIGKMRSRAGQALADAMMTHALHAQTDADADDFYAEARRRVWWMTYVCATQSSIVSNSPPPLQLYGAVFSTKYPTLAIDPEAWPVFIEAQQSILAATQFVIELNKALASHGDMEPIYARMSELEARIGPLTERAEAWTLTGPLAPPVDPAETCLVLSLRSMARIKLNSARIKIHRYCAFFDLPVFSGKHCDLTSVPKPAADGYEPLKWSCSCGGSLGGSSTPSGPASSATRSTPSVKLETAATASPESATSTPFSAQGPSFGSPAGAAAAAAATAPAAHAHAAAAAATAHSCVPPFSSHHSAAVCLRAAVNIARGFDGLPYPNPLGHFGQDSCFLSPTSLVVAPRMLPSYTCCAMQAAYVFLSVYRKTQTLPAALGLSGGGDGDADARYQLAAMVLQLQRGLASILGALENYGTAFEALRSMCDQIRLAAEQLMGTSL